MIKHYKTESWGYSVLVMEKTGKAFGRIYRYNDERTTFYLEGLSVDANARGKGMGNLLLKTLEEEGRRRGAKTFCLWVKKDTWMYKWYQRRGYSFLLNHEEEDFVYMSKDAF